MGLLERLLLFWPTIIIVVICTSIGGSLFLWFFQPSLRLLIVSLWIICIIRSTFNAGYTSPSYWYLRSILPGPSLEKVGWNIHDKSGFNHNKQALYIWYPHSHLGMIPFNLICRNMGSNIWKRPTTLCVAPPFFHIPALNECSLAFGLVKNDYTAMKDALKAGLSMVIIPGGTKEVHLAKSGSMDIVEGRKGFLRLAQDLGLPIIPVFAFGENEFFEGLGTESTNILHRLLKQAGGSYQWPSMSSVQAWLNGSRSAAADIYLGRPFNCQPSANLEDLQVGWMTYVDRFYAKCRPAHYDAAINWVPSKAK